MRNYSWQVEEVIWDRYCRGMKQSEIQRALLHDAATIEEIGGPTKMPLRTLSDKLRRLREERGKPEDWIFPGKEPEACDAMQREILVYASRQITRLLEADEPTDSQRKQLAGWQLLSTRATAHLRESEKDPQKQAAGRSRHLGGTSPDADLLAEIARKEDHRADRLATSGESA